MLPWYEFCQFGVFALVIHYIIAWYAQISWTPTYHITVPAARRVYTVTVLFLKALICIL
jgi:hypothetical protein